MGRALSKLKPVEEEDWLPLPPPIFPPKDSARARRAYALQQEVGLYGCEFAEIKHHLRARGRWGAMVRDGRFADVKRAWEGLKRGERAGEARRRRWRRRPPRGEADGLAVGARGVLAAAAEHVLRAAREAVAGRAATEKRATAADVVRSWTFWALLDG